MTRVDEVGNDIGVNWIGQGAVDRDAVVIDGEGDVAHRKPAALVDVDSVRGGALQFIAARIRSG